MEYYAKVKEQKNTAKKRETANNSCTYSVFLSFFFLTFLFLSLLFLYFFISSSTVARGGACLCAINCQLYLIGGGFALQAHAEDPHFPNFALATGEKFDFTTRKWTKIASMKTARRDARCVFCLLLSAQFGSFACCCLWSLLTMCFFCVFFWFSLCFFCFLQSLGGRW